VTPMSGSGGELRHCVQATIHFQCPQRLPYQIDIDLRRFREGVDPDAYHRIKGLSDQAESFLLHLWDESTDYFEHDEYIDIWGIHWRDGCPQEPVYSSVSMTPDFPLNEGSDWSHRVRKQVCEPLDSYRLGHVWFTLFERMHLLYGFETALTLPYVDLARFLVLRDSIVAHDLEKIDTFLELDVDGIFFSDDWGSQRGLLIDRKDWHRYYVPAYRRLFAPVLEAQKDIWFHSCGAIWDIIPDLIELGVRVLNPVQSGVLDITKLGRRFGGRVCFFGGLDVQQFLPKATPDAVEREIQNLVSTLGTPRGGYIGGTSHTILPDVPEENIERVYRSFSRYGWGTR
jgi:uroporphyrinogen decarboxylase